jgi:hypothetical protein
MYCIANPSTECHLSVSPHAGTCPTLIVLRILAKFTVSALLEAYSVRF